MSDTIRILSRAACTFRDAGGTALFTVTPADRFVIREAPAAIRRDPLFNWMLAEGSLETVGSDSARRLENAPAAGADAEGKRPAVKAAKA